MLLCAYSIKIVNLLAGLSKMLLFRGNCMKYIHLAAICYQKQQANASFLYKIKGNVIA